MPDQSLEESDLASPENFSSQNPSNELPAGELEGVMAEVAAAHQVLANALTKLPLDSEQFKVVQDASTKLTKITGNSKSKDLTESEVVNMINGLPREMVERIIQERQSAVPQELTGVANGRPPVDPELLSVINQGG